jgi:hypothetical protein
LQYSLGSAIELGNDTKNTKQNANTVVDKRSNLKLSHSIALALYNLGCEYLSINCIFISLNLNSCSKLLMVVDPEIVSEKCCITGAWHMPVNRANSRADAE